MRTKKQMMMMMVGDQFGLHVSHHPVARLVFPHLNEAPVQPIENKKPHIFKTQPYEKFF